MVKTMGWGSGVLLVLALAGCSGTSDAANSVAGAGAGNGGGAGGPALPSESDVAKVDLPRTEAATISADALSGAVSANNAMGLDLYTRLLATLPAGNVLSSPISASLALTMTYAGAAGNTATEMATALHLDPSLGSAIFDGQNALSQALASRGGAALAKARRNATEGNQAAPSSDDYDLHVVNSIWGDKSYTWTTPFLTTMAQSYGTGVHQEDFAGAVEAARLDINHWVSAETKDKINDLLAEGVLDSSTRMVLVNALHLRFPWASPFTVGQTTSAAFTRGGGSKVVTSFMNQTEGLAYVDDGQAQIARLPLSGGELSLVIALPHEDVDLTSYERALTPMSALFSKPSSSSVVVLSLPKTTFTSKTFSLAPAFRDMGMHSAFEVGAADFSGLCANPPNAERLYVSDILQKTTLSMQEVGVEAAAATAVILGATASYDPNPPVPPPPVPMTVNRPYLVALVDEPTGALLMLGHIVDPTDAGSQ